MCSEAVVCIMGAVLQWLSDGKNLLTQQQQRHSSCSGPVLTKCVHRIMRRVCVCALRVEEKVYDDITRATLSTLVEFLLLSFIERGEGVSHSTL